MELLKEYATEIILTFLTTETERIDNHTVAFIDGVNDRLCVIEIS